jgi:DNA-binding NtrC family response regulator
MSKEAVKLVGLTGAEPRPSPWGERDISRLIKQRLIGNSHWVRQARAAVALHAAHPNPVFIKGEPGTGKEFLARLIHDCSDRGQKPFLAISCSSVSEESLEAALFGSIHSLSSGRPFTRKGLVEKAEGGTLYINGVSSLSAVLQSKLTRLIEHHEYCRVGDSLPEAANVRVLLGSAHQAESRGEGIYIPVKDRLSIPPLRRRVADIEPLSRHFLSEYCRRLGKGARELAPETLALLRRHDWPGNVGELKRAMKETAENLRPAPIKPSLLPPYLVNRSGFYCYSLPDSGIRWSEEVKQFEIEVIRAALNQCGGVQTRAAQLLGLKLSTLNTKIKNYGIDTQSFK